MNFVSNAVMTGFTTGIALQIIAGVIRDATGYKPDSHNTIGKFVDAFTHIGSWQLAPCLVASPRWRCGRSSTSSSRWKRSRSLIALLVVTVAVDGHRQSMSRRSATSPRSRMRCRPS